MIQSHAIFALASITLLFTSPIIMAAKPPDLPRLHAVAVDPLVKVFRDSAVNGAETAKTDSARGEHATFQIVVTSAPVAIKDLRCEATSFTKVLGPDRITDASDAGGSEPNILSPPEVRFVGYVGSSVSASKPAKDQLRAAPAMYPDPLLPQDAIDVERGNNQPVWLTIPVPLEAVPGDYVATATLMARILGKPTSATVPLRLKIYPAQVKSTRLNVTLWYQMWYFNGHKMPERFSDAWFDVVQIYVKSMREHRQNWGWIETQDALKFSRDDDGRLQIDFTNFDRWVQLLLDGGMKMIEGQHFGFRTAGWRGPFGVQVWQALDEGNWKSRKVSPDSDEAQDFYAEYFPLLQAHLEEKGWLDKYVQHVADEPLDYNADSYTTAAQLLRKYAPKLRIMDACQSEKLTGVIDLWIPQLDHFEKGYKFFKERQKAGDEVWFYTCMYPAGEYANRFLELPLIKTRLLHWINFRYGATGYLHWGYNFWPPHVWEDAADYRQALLPAGDANIVYPGPDAGEFDVIDSIRYEAMRDGIEDHELLSQLAEQDAATAKQLARNVVRGFQDYDTDVARFRETRRELLEAVSALAGDEQ